MKGYAAYIRVSTPRQGERSSSLLEQKSAIEGYAHRHGMPVSHWFEETETAAKLGRPVFKQMMIVLDTGVVAGVITHKIDRSARNLKDWAALGELVDRGVELHFAHESIDLTSRGGRLSADIQAVVAADYIRNLRDEVRKGFYGRLKQGFYPLNAPVGYLNQGGGRVKSIDPIRGPLVAAAFDLYATGNWSLKTLAQELYVRGLRTRGGARVTHKALSTIFNNPFYFGIIRLPSSGEVFEGKHAAIVSKRTFDRVQETLRGKTVPRGGQHRFRYQRLLHCAGCKYALVAERQKGHVYYRCHSDECSGTCVREEAVDGALLANLPPLKLTDEEWHAVEMDLENEIISQNSSFLRDNQNLSLALSALNDRLSRLTDAFVDQILDKQTYLDRKERLLFERVELQARLGAKTANGDVIRERAYEYLELTKSLSLLAKTTDHSEFQRILKNATSNLTVRQKDVEIYWRNPFLELFKRDTVGYGGPMRCRPRTFNAKEMVEIIMRHSKDPANEGGDSLPLSA